MNDIVVAQYDMPEKKALLSPAEQCLAQMEAMVVDSPEMAQVAADERGSINTALKTNEERRLTIVRKIEESKEPVNALFKPVTDLLHRARAVVDAKLLAWNEKCENERKAREAAAAEQLRKQNEALEKRAEKAEAGGHVEKAAVLRETAAALPTAVVLPSTPKPAGMVERLSYGGECLNVVELCAHVVAHPEDANLVLPNGSAINARARSQRDAFKLPGCRLVKSKGVASRAA